MNKNALIRILAAGMLVATLASCARGEHEPKDTTPEAATDSTLNTTTDAPATQAPTTLDIVTNSATDFIILRSENAGEHIVSAAVKMRQAISDKTGVNISIVTDWVRRGEIADQTKPEIIIGSCERDVSSSIADTLEDRSFIIKVEGNKLVICGKTDKLTLQGVEYFIEHYMTDEYASASSLSLPRSLVDTQTNVKFDMTQLINSTDSYSTTQTKMFDIPNVDGYRIMQGGCTDGKYLYMAMENQSFAGDNHHSYIYKYDIATMKEVARSEALQLDHSNDICYNPNTGMLIVVHNAPRRNKLSFVDPETLTITGSKLIDFEIFSLAYCQERQQYVIGISFGQNFAILDKDFNRVKLYQVNSTGYTTQGVECDNDFIYFIQYNKNVIVIYDWSGKRVTIVDVSLTNCEPENICLVDDVFYVGCNNAKWTGGLVYEMRIVKN